MSDETIQFYLDRIKAMELRIKELESERKELIDFQCLLDDENHNLREQNFKLIKSIKK
jgi:hypothetical protein